MNEQWQVKIDDEDCPHFYSPICGHPRNKSADKACIEDNCPIKIKDEKK